MGGDAFTTVFCRPGSLADVDLLALERFVGREIGDGGDYVNVHTRDPLVVGRVVRLLGHRVEEVAEVGG